MGREEEEEEEEGKRINTHTRGEKPESRIVERWDEWKRTMDLPMDSQVCSLMAANFWAAVEGCCGCWGGCCGCCGGACCWCCCCGVVAAIIHCMMREEVQVNKEIRGVQVDKRGVTCQGETRKGGYRLRCDCNRKNQMRERKQNFLQQQHAPRKVVGYLVREKRVDPSPIFNCRRTSCCSFYVQCCCCCCHWL